jgi:hypothetical protein
MTIQAILLIDRSRVNAVTGEGPIPFESDRPNFSTWPQGDLTFPAGALNGARQDFSKVYEQIGVEKV